jgi:hypothetical protein
VARIDVVDSTWNGALIGAAIAPALVFGIGRPFAARTRPPGRAPALSAGDPGVTPAMRMPASGSSVNPLVSGRRRSAAASTAKYVAKAAAMTTSHQGGRVRAEETIVNGAILSAPHGRP